ncbi:MAG: helix-turn-helix transcriptional regulator [Clostridia bacterium]|nr:helix-turn-helix transcriptional regulator [Clostridia bacterium]
MPEIKVLAQRVLKFRNDLGENQFEFAEKCGISVYTVSAIESQNCNPRLETLQKIAAYTGSTVSELLMVE